MVNIRSVHIMT